MVWGRLARLRGPFRAQGSALTRNVELHMARRTCFREQYYIGTRRYYVGKGDGEQYQGETTYSFTGSWPAFIPGGDISSCACIVLLSEASSSSHVEFNIARQRRPLASETSILPCLTASDHEICQIGIMHHTLMPPNLSHMDFLDDPAAIHGCRLIISCTTKDAGPNEHMHPEILMINHHKFTYSFALIFPAFLPAT